MVVFVIGGSGSGKSSFAEETISRLSIEGDNIYYLATMKVYGDEGAKRVERHRKKRRHRNFITIEKSENIGEIINEYNIEDSGILIECLMNLVANEMFSSDSDNEVTIDNTRLAQISEKVICDLQTIIHTATNTVIVSGNVFGEGLDYDDSTIGYMDVLGKVNRVMTAQADKVYELVAGIPICIKDVAEEVL